MQAGSGHQSQTRCPPDTLFPTHWGVVGQVHGPTGRLSSQMTDSPADHTRPMAAKTCGMLVAASVQENGAPPNIHITQWYIARLPCMPCRPCCKQACTDLRHLPPVPGTCHWHATAYECKIHWAPRAGGAALTGSASGCGKEDAPWPRYGVISDVSPGLHAHVYRSRPVKAQGSCWGLSILFEVTPLVAC